MDWPFLKHQHHAVVRLGRAQAVDARDGRHDDHVAALEQRPRGAHAQLVELLVDRRFFLDKHIARWHVRFRLVVIVVADEVLDGVCGKNDLNS